MLLSLQGALLAGTNGWEAQAGGANGLPGKDIHPAASEPAEFIYAINYPDTNTVTVTGYAGPGGDVAIPSNISERIVTAIGGEAFYSSPDLTGIWIPDSVATIENGYINTIEEPEGIEDQRVGAFASCTGLASVAIGRGVVQIGDYAFYGCTRLDAIAIPDGVVRIGDEAFAECESLSRASIGNGVTNIGDWAFAACDVLNAIHFRGNAPGVDYYIVDHNTTFYRLIGATGWPPAPGLWPDDIFGFPTALWGPAVLADGEFGAQNGPFGFNVGWTAGQTIVVEAAADPAAGGWGSVETNTLGGDVFHFVDPQWTSHSRRCYRLRF